MRRPDEYYTIRSHQTTHGVTYPTAHSDLTDLHKRGLLERHKVGKEFRYLPVTDRLSDLFDSPWLAGRAPIPESIPTGPK